jgi:hypothetical protein
MVNSAMILTKVTFLLIERSSANLAQKEAEFGLAADTQHNPGTKLHNATRLDKTRRCLS